jgi:hypothetical protein
MENRMTLVENDLEREARLRANRMRSADIVNDPVFAPAMHTRSPVEINRHTAYLEGHDISAMSVAAVMILAPLAAYAIGLGA